MDVTERGADYLEHYGVKGMKWGVRRSDAQLARARGSKPEASEDKKTANSYQSRVQRGNTDNLSNAELKKLNERMQLEQNYSNLMNKKPTQSKGRRFMMNVVKHDGQKILQGQKENTKVAQTMKFGKVAIEGTTLIVGAAKLGRTLKKL